MRTASGIALVRERTLPLAPTGMESSIMALSAGM